MTGSEDVGGRIVAAVALTIAEHPDQVQAWLKNEPGAWGYLAGQGVIAARRSLGRALSDRERRAVWATLWTKLEALRQ